MDSEESATLERLERRIERLEASVFGDRTSDPGDNNNSSDAAGDRANNNRQTVVESLTTASELFRETIAYRQSIYRLRAALVSVRGRLALDELPELGDRAPAATEDDVDRFETMKRVIDSELEAFTGPGESAAATLRSLADRLVEIEREFDRVSGTIEQLLEAKRAARQCDSLSRRHADDIDCVRGALKCTFQKYVRLSSIFFGVLQRLSANKLTAINK